MDSKRIRIVSDGTPRGTQVFDADGKPLDMGAITKVEWSIDGCDGLGVARLTFHSVDIDVIGQRGE